MTWTTKQILEALAVTLICLGCIAAGYAVAGALHERRIEQQAASRPR